MLSFQPMMRMVVSDTISIDDSAQIGFPGGHIAGHELFASSG